MPSTLDQRTRWLMTQGMMEFEAYDYAEAYSIKEMRTLPYFVEIIQRRRSYINRRRMAGDSDQVIAERIRKVYMRNKWRNAWDRLRAVRKKAIEVGDYTPPPKKGSHHKTKTGHPKDSGFSAGNRKAQKGRAKQRDSEKDKLKEQIIQAQVSGNKQEWTRLQKIWNRKYA